MDEREIPTEDVPDPDHQITREFNFQEQKHINFGHP
jgi:hypothetical protein